MFDFAAPKSSNSREGFFSESRETYKATVAIALNSDSSISEDEYVVLEEYKPVVTMYSMYMCRVSMILPFPESKVMARVQRFIFVWNEGCIHSDELVSRHAAVGPYKNKSLSKCDDTIIYLLLHY